MVQMQTTVDNYASYRRSSGAYVNNCNFCLVHFSLELMLKLSEVDFVNINIQFVLF